MENVKVYESLNEETQKFILETFSFIDYFCQNNEEIDETDILATSIFLAGLSSDESIKTFFKDNDITLERLFDGQRKELKNIEDSENFTKLDISFMLREILNEIKQDYYLENEEVLLNDLSPYQIFDYILDMYYESIDTLLNNNGLESIYDSDVFLNYRAILEQKYAQFALQWGVDIFDQVENEVLESYNISGFNLILDNTTVYLSTLSGKKEEIKGINNETIEIPRLSTITEINGEKATQDVFHKFIHNFNSTNIITLKLIDDKGETIEFTTYRKNIFKDEKIENAEKVMTTPTLDKYGDDLTKGSYIKDPSVGRDEEIKKIMQVLLYPEKDKSIVITGEAGCGKTAIVRGLAYRVQNGDVPEPLKNIRIISIDTSTMVAGTKYVGMLEEKMKAILEEASRDKNIILFIDEIHQAISGGKSEGSDNTVSEILKPYLDYGKVRVIGATTTEEYNEYIEPNKAFKTRLKRISVKEPSNEVIFKILDDLIEAYNRISFSKLDTSYEERKMLINWLIESTKPSYRLYNDKASNPRLILDIIKEAYAIAALDNRQLVTREDLMEALRCEERLYDSSKQRQIEMLKRITPKPKRDCVILEFKPRK